MNQNISSFIEINKLICGNNNQCAVQLFKSSTPTINNIIVVDKLDCIKCVDPICVFFNNNKINADVDLIYTTKDDALSARIMLPKEIHIDKNMSYYAVPNIVPSKIGCPVCGNYYYNGQSKCDCIQYAPNIYAADIIVKSIDIFDAILYEDFVDFKTELLSDFFGGAVSKLTLLEPLI